MDIKELIGRLELARQSISGGLDGLDEAMRVLAETEANEIESELPVPEPKPEPQPKPPSGKWRPAVFAHNDQRGLAQLLGLGYVGKRAYYAPHTWADVLSTPGSFAADMRRFYGSNWNKLPQMPNFQFVPRDEFKDGQGYKRLLAGQYDNQIADVADRVRALNMQLCWAAVLHEMFGNWYPYGMGAHKNHTREDAANGFIHIVNIVKPIVGENVKLVHVWHRPHGCTPEDQRWVGERVSSYADAFGFDLYPPADGVQYPHADTQRQQLGWDRLNIILPAAEIAEQHGIPIIGAEVGPRRGRDSDGDVIGWEDPSFWFRGIMEYLLELNAPAVCLFNHRRSGLDGDTMISRPDNAGLAVTRIAKEFLS